MHLHTTPTILIYKILEKNLYKCCIFNQKIHISVYHMLWLLFLHKLEHGGPRLKVEGLTSFPFFVRIMCLFFSLNVYRLYI